MVAESSQGTGFLLEGPSARSATNHPSANHQNFPGVFRYYGGYASTPTQPRRALTRSPVLANSLSSRPSPPSAQVEARTRRTITQTHRTQETRAELHKSAFTRAAHTRTVKLFFHHHPDHLPMGLALAGRPRPQGACFPPSGS